jgi:hypothetical protein
MCREAAESTNQSSSFLFSKLLAEGKAMWFEAIEGNATCFTISSSILARLSFLQFIVSCVYTLHQSQLKGFSVTCSYVLCKNTKIRLDLDWKKENSVFSDNHFLFSDCLNFSCLAFLALAMLKQSAVIWVFVRHQIQSNV